MDDKELVKKVSEEDFAAYEAVRVSGVTNMFMVNTVSELSGLPVTQIKLIIMNYSQLRKIYPNVRKDSQPEEDRGANED